MTKRLCLVLAGAAAYAASLALAVVIGLWIDPLSGADTAPDAPAADGPMEQAAAERAVSGVHVRTEPTAGEPDMPESWPEGTKALFVGNSLVEGMRLNSDGTHAFLCETGISLKALNDRLELPENYDLAIIEMGSNELGAYSEEDFKDEYVKLTETLDRPCWCLSIPPVDEARSKYAARINNDNVELYNGFVRDVCRETGATYIDCSGFFGDMLDPSWTTDGLHLKGDIYAGWYGWVLRETGLDGPGKETG